MGMGFGYLGIPNTIRGSRYCRALLYFLFDYKKYKLSSTEYILNAMTSYFYGCGKNIFSSSLTFLNDIHVVEGIVE